MKAPKVPGIFNFFRHMKGHNRFEYQPRYYDENKEKMQERYERISKELDSEVKEDRSEQFKNQLHHSWERTQHRTMGGGRMKLRIIIYAIILLGLAYLMLNK